MNANLTPGTYALAHDLKGFQITTLRVKIIRIASPYDVIVVTASLSDVGTPLVLDPAQLEPEVPETVQFYSGGLVAFG